MYTWHKESDKGRYIGFSRQMLEEFTFYLSCAPFPDRGRKANLGLRFLTLELRDIWKDYSGEEPRRSDKRRRAGSEEGEFGGMVVRILELMDQKSILVGEDRGELLNACPAGSVAGSR
jgi:hypothetical protein